MSTCATVDRDLRMAIRTAARARARHRLAQAPCRAHRSCMISLQTISRTRHRALKPIVAAGATICDCRAPRSTSALMLQSRRTCLPPSSLSAIEIAQHSRHADNTGSQSAATNLQYSFRCSPSIDTGLSLLHIKQRRLGQIGRVRTSYTPYLSAFRPSQSTMWNQLRGGQPTDCYWLTGHEARNVASMHRTRDPSFQ